MNKPFLAVIGAVLIVLFLPISAYAGGNRDRNETETSGNTFSLLEAIEQSAERIASELPAGSRVAVVAFESDSENLSQFIMEELVGALHDHRIEVADRENLPFLERELNFQLSGNVSDESMQSIGKFLGAELVITGQMRHLGNTYRFTTNAIRVETAVHASIPRLNVRNDNNLQSMIAALNNQTAVVREARYTVPAEPQTAGTFFDRGLRFAVRGEYELAIADFTEALRLNPNMAGAYIMRGMTYGFQENYNSGIADLNQAIRLDPNSASAYHNRGNMHLNLRNYDRAIADYTQSIRLGSDNTNTYFLRALAYNARGDIDRAAADLEAAIQLDPKYLNDEYILSLVNLIPDLLQRANARYRNGEFNLAIADFSQVLRIIPDVWSAYDGRGNAYLEIRDADNAITDFRHVIRLNPSYTYAYSNLSYAYALKGDYDRAIAELENLLRLFPNLPANDRDIIRNNINHLRQLRGR